MGHGSEHKRPGDLIGSLAAHAAAAAALAFMLAIAAGTARGQDNGAPGSRKVIVQAIYCLPPPVVERALRQQFGQTLKSVARSPGLTTKLYQNAAGSWTGTAIDATGLECIIGAGDRELTPEK